MSNDQSSPFRASISESNSARPFGSSTQTPPRYGQQSAASQHVTFSSPFQGMPRVGSSTHASSPPFGHSTSAASAASQHMTFSSPFQGTGSYSSSIPIPSFLGHHGIPAAHPNDRSDVEREPHVPASENTLRPFSTTTQSPFVGSALTSSTFGNPSPNAGGRPAFALGESTPTRNSKPSSSSSRRSRSSRKSGASTRTDEPNTQSQGLSERKESVYSCQTNHNFNPGGETNHDDNKTVLESFLHTARQLKKEVLNLYHFEQKTKDALNDLDAFVCPITREYMKDPVICLDGHTYERDAIEEWLKSHSRSPKTNQPLASLRLIPNHALRASIETILKLREELKLSSPSNSNLRG